MPHIVAIIPARGGSKGVPGKNIKPLGGFPVIAYSVMAARACSEISRVVVSTDCPKIAAVARACGAEVPFMRPSALSGDRSPDRDFVIHALDWFLDHEGSEPDYLVHLRPTTPLRDPEKMTDALRTMLTNSDATSLRSAHELAEPPQKMLTIRKGFFAGFFPDDPRPEYYNLPRQAFPKAYHPNGYIDILSVRHVRSSDSLHGTQMLAFETPHTIEIDAPTDFEWLEFMLGRQAHPLYHQLRDAFQNGALPVMEA